MDKQLLLPASIFGGCALIGLGLYFGLQARPPATPSAAAEAAPPSTSAVALAPSPSASPILLVPPSPFGPGGAQPTLSASAQAAAEKAAADALAAEKKNIFLPKCWQPAVAKQPEPDKARYRVVLGFNAEGIEMARGISDDRSAPRYDVADCLRQLPTSMHIPPPGAQVQVTLTLDFP